MTTAKHEGIRIDFPVDENPLLRLTVAPIRLKIAAGAESPWISGAYTDPSGEMPLEFRTNGPVTRIISSKRVTALRKGIPRLSLELGTGKPFALSIESGATDSSICDLGGIPLSAFGVKFGTGKCEIDVSRANPHQMEKLSLSAGAAETTLRNLANANASEISIEGGAMQLTIDFGGTLQRNSHARINAGMAAVAVSVPGSTAAKIKTSTTLSSLSVGDGFTVREGAYWTPAAMDGQTPVLLIDTTTALGAFKLTLTS